MKGVRWLGVYTPLDGLVHVVGIVSDRECSNPVSTCGDSISWWCPAFEHGVHSRKFVNIKKLNCIPCIIAYMLGWDYNSSRCHYVE